MSAAILLGRSQVEIGAVGEQSGDGYGAALSRGGATKPYAHTDPNEDAVLAARGARGAVVAVADGHWGTRASEVALEIVRAAHLADFLDGPERSADRWYQCVLHLVVAANDAILKAQTDEQRSRTTFSLALARPADKLLVATSVGDSHLFVGSAAGVREVLQKTRRVTVLGHERWTPSQTERNARFDVCPLDDADVLVAVTDGLSEQGIGVEDPLAAVTSAVAATRSAPPAARAAQTARAIVDAALAAHVAHRAGDNVSAGVVWLGS
jgi:serine/threonine protein phosphatase PrpC